MAYLDLENDVKPYLNIPADNHTDDSDLQDMIATAVRTIEAPSPIGTGRVFEAAADTTRYFDAVADVDGPDLLFWDDLIQITSVTNGNGIAVAPSAYVKIPNKPGVPAYGLRLKRSASVIWTWSDSPEASIAVTGRWAYSIVPDAYVKQLALRLVGWLYRIGAGTVNDTTIVTENGLIYPAALPKDIRAGLEGLRSQV
jgi:hypothetical protein